MRPPSSLPMEKTPGLMDQEWEMVEASSANDSETNIKNKEKDSPVHSPSSLFPSTDGVVIDLSHITTFRDQFEKDTSGRIAQNAATSNWVVSLTTSRALLQTSLSPYFGINLDHGGMPATDQKDSGRCWMFGTLNLFRFGTRDKLHLDDFEFSESYLLFYYLLEQVNYYLECVMATSDKTLDDRLVSMFIDSPVDDGGDWGVAVNLIKKYGLVPKDVYPESFSSGYTDELDNFLNQMVTNAAFGIRTALEAGADTDKARQLKWKCVANCHRVLTIHLGTPPTPCSTFDWHWRDTNDKFHSLIKVSPQDFCREFVTVPYDSYVSLIQDPRHEYYHCYQVAYSMPICGGAAINFINIPAEEMKTMALAMLQDGLPVLFACIVENELDDEHGLWDAELYEKTEFYGVSLTKMTKADRIRYGSSMGDHIMLITGVDLAEDGSSPRRWRVENSWGQDGGDNGYYTMNDNWFNENVFEIVAPPQYLSESAAQGLETPVRKLPAWDPMCSGGKRCQRRRSSKRHR